MSNPPRSGTYVGPLDHLKGKTALLRWPPEGGYVLAQFDDRDATRSGHPVESMEMADEPHCRFQTLQLKVSPPNDALGWGWHRFRAEEFSCD